MARILAYVEHHGGETTDASYEVMAAARTLVDRAGGEVEALVVAADPEGPTARLAKADRVLVMRGPAFRDYLPEAHVACLAAAIRARAPDVVLMPSSSVGLDLGPAVATLCRRPFVGYCAEIGIKDGTLETKSRLFGGKIAILVRVPQPAILSVTPGSYHEEDGRAGGDVEIIDLDPPERSATHMRLVETMAPERGSVDLSQAERILCVGRGIGNAANIEMAQEVAALLGAELAGSRPVIDSGWLPKPRQVGKSGVKVKPRLYLAVGVSGAPEHVEGMMASDLIIAINSDPGAPIFGIAHYGATCDLLDFLPALRERLTKPGA